MPKDRALEIALVNQSEIRSHKDECARRYLESKESMERLTLFIKEAHKQNRDDIGQLKDTIAEQRGAGKMAKIMTSIGASVLGFIGGVGGSHILK